MFHRFQHEQQFYPQLDRLPLYARMKLDMTGVKLSLRQWLAFSLEERRVVCHLPVDSSEERQTFVEYINFLCRNHAAGLTQMMAPLSAALWDTPGRVPPAVVESSTARERAVTLDEWTRWRFHERYALYKTAMSKNEPEEFSAVLLELRQRNAGS